MRQDKFILHAASVKSVKDMFATWNYSLVVCMVLSMIFADSKGIDWSSVLIVLAAGSLGVLTAYSIFKRYFLFREYASNVSEYESAILARYNSNFATMGIATLILIAGNLTLMAGSTLIPIILLVGGALFQLSAYAGYRKSDVELANYVKQMEEGM